LKHAYIGFSNTIVKQHDTSSNHPRLSPQLRHMRRRAVPRACLLLLLVVVLHVASSITHAAAPACGCLPASQCTFRVLAVGDSLTRGAVPSRPGSFPYSTRMAEVLRERLAGRANVQATTAGRDWMGVWQKARDASGNEVDLTLVPFAAHQLAQAKAAGQRFQWAVVLGAINDLGNANKSAAVVMPRLTQVRVWCWAWGSHTSLLLTPGGRRARARHLPLQLY
jgi:hypothetical protein